MSGSGADEDDEDFGWGEDDQDEDDDDDEDERGKDLQNSDDAAVLDPATTTCAGGALGAMNMTEDTERIAVPSGAVGKGRSFEGGRLIEENVLAGRVVDSNDVECARLAEALRVSEAERASMIEALAEVEELTKERDAALAEVRLLLTF